MINQATLDKLREMRLTGMADALREQMKNSSYGALSFEERVGIVVDAEWCKRRSAKLEKLICDAKFSDLSASVEGIDYLPERGLDRSMILKLSTCNYIREGRHIILKGASGCGKTWMGCAFGNAACRNFFTVRYIRLPELLNDFAIAKGEGTLKKVIKAYQKVGLLILDEWLLKPLTTDQAMDLFEIIEARTRNGSMIFCTQFDPRGWYERIGTNGDSTVSEAIIDRIMHNTYEIHLKGNKSMREYYGMRKE